MRVLDDAAVAALITPALAVRAARDAVLAAYRGTLVAPPRTVVPAGDIDLVFTVGGLIDGASGFRVYGRWPGDSDQAVMVWQPDGRLRGLVVGDTLGALRTGALGAVALDALAPADLTVLAVIGTGQQAWTQLWASTAVRTPALVRIFGRNSARREAFAHRARTELGLTAHAVASAEEAVSRAPSVILATTAATPVLAASWLADTVHLTTVGPRLTGHTELPLDLVGTAALMVSDSPAQLAVMDDPLWQATPATHLGAVLAGHVSVPASGLRLYCSAGLGGSEVVLADRLLDL
jgi:alanine dehydrogenase